MTTVLSIFITSFILALALTPLSAKLGMRLGAIDLPGHRKMHTDAKPRTGGAAIFISFLLTMIAGKLWGTKVTDLLAIDQNLLLGFSGAILCFGIGIVDDFKRLGPRVNMVAQIAAATLAFTGGIRIEHFSILGFNLEFGWLSYAVTVFWFLLLINAINLIDGLDGLAAGIVFFTGMFMMILSVTSDHLETAMLFAALAGATLGFLRYNFNPASIFLGDGGSYFLGYMIAAISISGAVKSQVGALVLIPLISLGVPLFDTLFSTLRRFIQGQRLFSPDMDHVHHRLLKLGFSTRRTVFFIYGFTVALCLSALLIVNLRDETAGLFLAAFGVAVFLLVRRLGYFSYFQLRKMHGWLSEITDDMGVTHNSRRFLGLQMELSQCERYEDLQNCVLRSLQFLGIDEGRLQLNRKGAVMDCHWRSTAGVNRVAQEKGSQSSSVNKGCGYRGEIKTAQNQDEQLYGAKKEQYLNVDLPLVSDNNRVYGRLLLNKEISNGNGNLSVFKRLETLRRNIIETLDKIEEIESNEKTQS